ncbi:hypothetical protein RS9916_32187 [Synechococcus sp. RS9916]|nr:hypothetical protein RS9916_32187 [Synechococcus sp. RS9916]
MQNLFHCELKVSTLRLRQHDGLPWHRDGDPLIVLIVRRFSTIGA